MQGLGGGLETCVGLTGFGDLGIWGLGFGDLGIRGLGFWWNCWDEIFVGGDREIGSFNWLGLMRILFGLFGFLGCVFHFLNRFF